MADDTLEAHNYVLATALLQDQQKSQAALGPKLLAPKIGGGQDATKWIGGSNRPGDTRARP